MAEALNNVAEHAYELRGTGDITVTLQVGAKGVSVDIVDRGLALPDFILPEGRLPSLKQPRNAMPEGGFGWFLIRNQTDVLSYDRREDCNHLHLHLPHEMR
jgi:serine/threonine-protein kinase RsbW